MIGIDLTRISRFENVSEDLINRILSPSELNNFNHNPDKAKFLATHWAVKEALFKSDNKYSNFNEITIAKINNRWVFEDYEISTSDEGDFIIAIVTKKEICEHKG